MSTGNAVLGSQRCYDQLEAIKPAKAHSAKNPRRTIAVKQVPNIGVKIAALEQALHQLLIFFCSIMCFFAWRKRGDTASSCTANKRKENKCGTDTAVSIYN